MIENSLISSITAERLRELGCAVLKNEAQAITNLIPRVNDNFITACHYLHSCAGRIVVIGMGKSGHIGSKIAATFASTGNPAFFVHPAEANHGDLGMITSKDVVLIISNTGETTEILSLLPILKMLNVPLITMTGNQQSSLAQAANVNLDVSVDLEACPLGLAPTSSTTAALAMGDALAIALLEARGFTTADFARTHPGGSLGRRLLLRCQDIMHQGEKIPRVSEQTLLHDALIEITQKGFGMTIITDAQNRLVGVFTDGDLRRAFDLSIDLQKTPIETIMTRNAKTISPDLLAAEALRMMKEFKITSLVITDPELKPIGLIHMHDLLRAGLA